MDEDEAASADGLAINHAYADMRGCDADDLAHAIADDADFLDAAANVDLEDWNAVVELLDWHFEEAESSVDPGVTAAVVAISAAGGAPITSCNGGWFGDDHASKVPHVLFSVGPDEVGIFEAAAEASGCGLSNNGRYAELYADRLPNLLAFAREVQGRI